MSVAFDGVTTSALAFPSQDWRFYADDANGKRREQPKDVSREKKYFSGSQPQLEGDPSKMSFVVLYQRCVVQPCLHSPRVVTGHLNVAKVSFFQRLGCFFNEEIY